MRKTKGEIKRTDRKTPAGKHVQTYELRLPVSGRTVSVIESGLLTARKMEALAGYERKKPEPGSEPESAMDTQMTLVETLIGSADKLAKEFVPKHCPELNMDELTDDDLWAITIQIYFSGMSGSGEVVRSFPEDGNGGESGGDGVGDEKAPE